MTEQDNTPGPEQRQADPISTDPMSLERRQPDPMLQLSGRRLGGGGISLVALVILVVLAVVLFGLNGRDTEKTASNPSQPPAHAASPHG